MTPTTPLILAEPDKPFWGFSELLLAVAIFLAALGGIISFTGKYFHASPESGIWTVIDEAAAYVILFLALKLMFARYGKRVLESLGWTTPGPFSAQSLALVGLGLSVVVVVLQYVLRTPDVDTPFEKLLDDPASRVAVAIFGISFGPMVEELLFRGFLQPLLVGVIGVFPGILLTSILFGLPHLAQNANIWQSGLLISLVGFVLGVVRHVSGSTKASTIVHIAYNSLPFMALLASGNPLTKT